MEQTGLGSSRAIMKLAFTVKWFSILMFSWNISISGLSSPHPRRTERANIRTYSARWTSLRALLWMADVVSQTCKECTPVCCSDKGTCTLSHEHACVNLNQWGWEMLIYFFVQRQMSFIVCKFIVHVHMPWHTVQSFSWCSHERL